MTSSTATWIPLPLDGVGLREIVHFACAREPDGKLMLEDGRTIALPISDLELDAQGALQVSMERHDDGTYIARYSGPDLVIGDIGIDFGHPGWDREFADDVRAWAASGFVGNLDYVVNARIALRDRAETEDPRRSMHAFVSAGRESICRRC